MHVTQVCSALMFIALCDPSISMSTPGTYNLLMLNNAVRINVNALQSATQVVRELLELMRSDDVAAGNDACTTLLVGWAGGSVLYCEQMARQGKPQLALSILLQMAQLMLKDAALRKK